MKCIIHVFALMLLYILHRSIHFRRSGGSRQPLLRGALKICSVMMPAQISKFDKMR